MRSLFLAMIPSVILASEVAVKEPVANNNDLIAIFHPFWQRFLESLSVNKLVLGGEFVIGIVILVSNSNYDFSSAS